MYIKEELISIIMPVFNSEDYIEDSILSILNQTYKNFELIILDDGSTDDSKQVIEQYSEIDSRIRPFYSLMNIGIVNRLNEGISLAKGAIIARMDSDDISLPNRLEIQLIFLINNPLIDVVGTSTITIDVNGDQTDIIRRSTNSLHLYWISFFSNPLSHPTVMFKKESVLAAGGYMLNQYPVEDFELWLRVMKSGRISNIDEPLLKYRVHSNSISKSNADFQLNKFKNLLDNHWQTNGIDNVDLCLMNVSFLNLKHTEHTIKKIFSNFNKLIALKRKVENHFQEKSEKINIDFINRSLYIFSILKKKSVLLYLILVLQLFASHPILLLNKLWNLKSY